MGERKGRRQGIHDRIYNRFFPARDTPRDAVSAWMERNPEKAYFTAIVLVPVFAVLVLAQGWVDDYRLERGGRELVATVTAIDPTQHGGHLTVAYTVGGRLYSRETGLGDDGRYAEDFHPGDTVRITYLPSEPWTMRAGHRPRNTLAGVAEMAGAAALAAAVVWYLPMYHAPRRKRREAAERAARSAAAGPQPW